eukprot:scaffold129713_cov20-Tisochrysis_lutea.AAC.6
MSMTQVARLLQGRQHSDQVPVKPANSAGVTPYQRPAAEPPSSNMPAPLEGSHLKSRATPIPPPLRASRADFSPSLLPSASPTHGSTRADAALATAGHGDAARHLHCRALEQQKQHHVVRERVRQQEACVPAARCVRLARIAQPQVGTLARVLARYGRGGGSGYGGVGGAGGGGQERQSGVGKDENESSADREASQKEGGGQGMLKRGAGDGGSVSGGEGKEAASRADGDVGADGGLVLDEDPVVRASEALRTHLTTCTRAEAYYVGINQTAVVPHPWNVSAFLPLLTRTHVNGVTYTQEHVCTVAQQLADALVSMSEVKHTRSSLTLSVKGLCFVVTEGAKRSLNVRPAAFNLGGQAHACPVKRRITLH